jgi:hypothetical protein
MIPMQVYEPTPDHLALWTKPNWLVMALGMLMILLGCTAAVVPAKATTLTITRWAPAMGGGEIHHTNLVRDRRIVRIPLRMLAGAMVTPGRIGGRESFYRLDLDVRDGEGPFFFAWYGNKAAATADAARINAFVASKDLGELVVQNDKRPFYVPLGSLIAFIGITFLFWSSLGVRATFDRLSRQVTVLRRGLLGTNVDVVAFGDIKDFKVAGISGDCQLYLELNSGRKVTLSSSTDLQNMIGPRRIRAIRLDEAERLRAFCAPAERVG